MNKYVIEIELPNLKERFSWQISERTVERLQHDMARGELGPAKILSITPVCEEERAG